MSISSQAQVIAGFLPWALLFESSHALLTMLPYCASLPSDGTLSSQIYDRSLSLLPRERGGGGDMNLSDEPTGETERDREREGDKRERGNTRERGTRDCDLSHHHVYDDFSLVGQKRATFIVISFLYDG